MYDESLPSAPQHSTAHTSPANDVSFVKLSTEHYEDQRPYAESESSAGRTSSAGSHLVHQRHDRYAHRPQDVNHNSSASRSRKAGGFLLPAFANVNTHKPNDGMESNINGAASKIGRVAEKGRSTVHQHGNSPSLPLTTYGEVPDQQVGLDRGAGQSTMDPAQLVQMALSLSEGRRRHVSNAMPITISPASTRRAAIDSGYDTLGSGSPVDKRPSHFGNSLRLPTPTTPPTSHFNNSTLADSNADDHVFYTFTPATLSRAEKARRYFELASEHRRLLGYLPPLKPDATAQGNYTLHSTSSPGSAHYEVTRVFSNDQSQRHLGREFNPLQALRNRRTRNRERRSMPTSLEAWQETDSIKRWVDNVEVASRTAMYRPGDDRVQLPLFPSDPESGPTPKITERHHRRQDTASSAITRPANGWAIEPSELLADVYWIEVGDNKTVLEDKQGNFIFPQRPRQSVDRPRSSVENAREALSANIDEYSQGEDSADDDRRKYSNRHKLAIPNRLRRNRGTRSESTTSNSSDEGWKRPQLKFDATEGVQENVAPLERQMRAMIARENAGELSSPELVSPNHWDAEHIPSRRPRSSLEQLDFKSRDAHNDKLSTDTSRKRRSSSLEEKLVSTNNRAPSSREHSQDAIPDSSAPTMRGLPNTLPADNRLSTELPSGWQHTSMLNSHGTKRSAIEQSHLPDSSRFRQPAIPLSSTDDTFRRSTDLSRPVQIKRLGTSDGVSKESSSKRFFKGGRLGELVRGEGGRLGDRIRGTRDRVGESDSASGIPKLRANSTDLDPSPNGIEHRDRDDQSSTDSDISPRASLDRERPKAGFYTMNLPNFKSSHERSGRGSRTECGHEQTDNERKDLAPTQGAPDRANSPVLPTIRLPTGRPNSADGVGKQAVGAVPSMDDRTRSESPGGLSLVQTNASIPPTWRTSHLPMTGLAKEDAKRQWSISDQTLSGQASEVMMRDIIRVRALLLASGIKAREIHRQADTVRDPPPAFLLEAAQTTGQTLQNVSRKRESMVAASLLAKAVDTSTARVDKAFHDFRSNTAEQLASRIEHLSHRAGEQLTKIVNETSDEADAFVVELTTKQPQEIKRVYDAIETLIRQRNRQFRWLRHAGFKLLEWLVLGIMWWVWFVVVLFNTGKKTVLGLVRILRWLFSL